MREILFRGKNVIGGQWLNGDLIHTTTGKAPMIRVHGKNSAISYMVVPETICQYTGLTDKNGKRIFEGDIVVIYSDEKHPVQIVFLESSWTAVTPKYRYYRHRMEDIEDKYEVIGNIHDNPELIAEVQE